MLVGCAGFTPMTALNHLAVAALALGVLPFRAAALTRTTVDVVVDFTPEGRRIAHPTPRNPAYYLPVIFGFQELGQVVAGEKPADQRDVAHTLAVELARQGYLLMHPAPRVDGKGELTFADGTLVRVTPRPGRRTPFQLDGPDGVPLTWSMLEDPGNPYYLRRPRAAEPTPFLLAAHAADPVHGPVLAQMPSLILSIHFGTMNPEKVDLDPTDPTQRVFFNQPQMLALVGGNTLSHLDLDFEREDVLQGADEDRYFVMVTAYDFAAYARNRKRVMLWQAKMSAPSQGVWFSDVLTALVTAGGPFFGVETLRPKLLTLPVTPEGRVKIGTPTVKDYFDGPAPKAPRAK